MIKIKHLSVSSPFRYLWLKYVIDVDLSQHCAKCLIGAFSKKIDNKLKEEKDILLDEAPARAYYLCGVSQSYAWVRNVHLAFREKEGEILRFKSNGIEVIIENAERIKFNTDDIELNDPNAKKKIYATCRNWQFAHHFKKI